jgi:hypothetical protein
LATPSPKRRPTASHLPKYGYPSQSRRPLHSRLPAHSSSRSPAHAHHVRPTSAWFLMSSGVRARCVEMKSACG